MIKKLSPAQLEALGLSRKSERYQTDDGQIISKRQAQNLKQIGSYNPGIKNTVKQHTGARGKSKEYREQVAKEQRQRIKKRPRQSAVRYLQPGNDKGDITIEVDNILHLIDVEKLAKELEAQQMKKGYEAVQIVVGFQFNQAAAMEANYKHKHEDEPNEWKAIGFRWAEGEKGRKKMFDLDGDSKLIKGFQILADKGIHPRKRSKYRFTMHFRKR